MAARAAVPRSASTAVRTCPAVGSTGGGLAGSSAQTARRAGGLTHDESFFLLLNVDEDQAAGMGHGGRGVAAGQLMLAG
jgi:hypothetical protein